MDKIKIEKGNDGKIKIIFYLDQILRRGKTLKI